MKHRLSAVLALAVNLLIIVFTVFAVSQFFYNPNDGFMQVAGFTCFRYFTIDSNVLCALSCLAALPACVAGLRSKCLTLPRSVRLFRFAGTSAVTVTLLTVIFFLGPTMGYAGMFAGPSLWLHGVNPVLAILCFCLLESQEPMAFRESWLAVLPVAVYACFYVPLVVFLHVWPDFYGFNVGGLWYVSAPVMLLAAYGIGAALTGIQHIKLLQQVLNR